ncbi:MAG: hypothetical protein LBH73_00020 [Spirochaetaceae bacterium]|jgi:hypothetical protein|nr:hypothetical protein [Spirochaetaceae bacterium]
MRASFEEISIKAIKRWVDDNGHKRQKTKTFSQTVNPFNRDKNGAPKSRRQIYEELFRKRDAWLKADEKEAKDERH